MVKTDLLLNIFVENVFLTESSNNCIYIYMFLSLYCHFDQFNVSLLNKSNIYKKNILLTVNVLFSFSSHCSNKPIPEMIVLFQ